MKVLNIGSLNLDYVYNVDHIVLPGETEASSELNVHLGGKGMNQSVALAKAGAEVYHSGMIGPDGQPFLNACREFGVNAQYLRQIDTKSGHAIIQLDRNAQNSILLYGGANQMLTEEFVDEVLDNFGSEDLLLLQNEVNLLPHIVDRAHERGMTIALNPSPFNEKLDAVDFGKIGIFLLNEVEGFQITGLKAPEDILARLQEQYPQAKIVLTLGKDGAFYADPCEKHFQPSFPVHAVDTTAAGDTFTGYFLAGLCRGLPIRQVLTISAKAAAIAVSRKGAVPSIPSWGEVITAITTTIEQVKEDV